MWGEGRTNVSHSTSTLGIYLPRTAQLSSFSIYIGGPSPQTPRRMLRMVTLRGKYLPCCGARGLVYTCGGLKYLSISAPVVQVYTCSGLNIMHVSNKLGKYQPRIYCYCY